MQGVPEANGILQQIRPKRLDFRKAILLTAPNFRPFEKSQPADISGGRAPVPRFLSAEEDASGLEVFTSERPTIDLDDVSMYAQKSVVPICRSVLHDIDVNRVEPLPASYLTITHSSSFRDLFWVSSTLGVPQQSIFSKRRIAS